MLFSTCATICRGYAEDAEPTLEPTLTHFGEDNEMLGGENETSAKAQQRAKRASKAKHTPHHLSITCEHLVTYDAERTMLSAVC